MWPAIAIALFASQAFGNLRDYDERLVYSKLLSRVKKAEATRVEVRKLLGEPYQVVYTPYRTASGVEFFEQWLYATKKKAKFPTLGTVTFGANGRVSRVVGDQKPPEGLCNIMQDVDGWMERIAAMPGLYNATFNSRKVVDICTRLVKMPFKDAMALICEYARIRPNTESRLGEAPILKDRWDGCDGQIGILLLTLFDGDREMGRDVFPHNFSLKAQSNPNDIKYLGEVVIWNGWPVAIPTGHMPNGGWSYESKLLSIALKRKAFRYRPPSTPEPGMLDYRGLCTLVSMRLRASGETKDFWHIFGNQLGLNQEILSASPYSSPTGSLKK